MKSKDAEVQTHLTLPALAELEGKAISSDRIASLEQVCVALSILCHFMGLSF